MQHSERGRCCRGHEMKYAWNSLEQYWLDCVTHGRGIREVKGKSPREWNPESDVVGLLGELTYAIEAGYDLSALDFRAWRHGGDVGWDFAGRVDVKATVHESGHLLEYPDKDIRAEQFALVVIDMLNQRGRLVGVVTAVEVRAAPLKDFGAGERLALSQKYIEKNDIFFYLC